MSDNIQFSVSDEPGELAHLGRNICSALVQNELDDCIALLVKYASKTGYSFSNQTKALLTQEVRYAE